jgi:guanylate cyclase
MVWAFAAPMGALVFISPRAAAVTMAAFIALTVLSGLLDAQVAGAVEPVPAGVRTTMFVLDIVGVASVTMLVLAHFVHQRDVAQRALAAEQARSEALLTNMLPSSVAERLKRGEKVADACALATVLFIDLVGSTALAARLPAQQMVDLLDRAFSALDDLAREHGITKIKTVGDAWMGVAGVPDPRADHAEAAAEMALGAGPALAAALGETGTTVRTRIGMHTGSVIAGVIGRRTVAFDVWGSTVNIASRMESQGLPDRIQVSLATAERLRPRYVLESRGTIDVRGVGEMATYLLVGRAGLEGRPGPQARSVPGPMGVPSAPGPTGCRAR